MNKLDEFSKIKIVNPENKYIIDEFINYYGYIYTNYATSGKTTKENFYKLAAIKKTIDVISKLKKKLLSGEDLESVKGIGPKTITRINEIIQTGHLAEIQTKIIKSELASIYGIGPVKASYYFDKYNITTLDEFIKRVKKGEIKITKQIELGIKYKDTLAEKIPRILIARIENFVQKKLYNIDNDYVSVICGSFRREKDYSSDIDILITHKNLKNKNKSKFYLEKAVKELEKDFIVDSLTENYNNHFQGFASVLRVGDLPNLTNTNFDIKKVIRVDIIMVPTNCFYTALLHFTGSGEFNQKLRLHAKNLNMKLSEYGLFKYINNKFTLIKTESEEDIFNNLLLKYLPPNKR